MVGATGFEPATTCTPIESVDRPGGGSALQLPVKNQDCASRAFQPSQGLAPFSQNFAASLLLRQTSSATEAAPVADSERLLTVKEVAKRLQVCNATVYKLCEKGELAHVRILNSIRITPADLFDLIRSHKRVLR
jgi:excisionase family DNA binding protein